MTQLSSGADALTSPVSSYIRRVRQLETLSREQELVCAQKWHDFHDESSGNMLVRSNLRYVVAVALSYRHYGLSLSELIAEGNYGLVYALTKFDPTRGTRFVTYATYWIRAHILKFIIRSWTMVGAGAGPLRSKLFFRLRREWARAENLVGDRQQATRLLSERMGDSSAKLEQYMQRLQSRDVSLDTEMYDDNATTMLDRIVSDWPNQEDALGYKQDHQNLQQTLQMALSQLDTRERFIVEFRLMADSEEVLSLAEIGRRLGVSRERARQLEVRAKRKLQERLSHLRDYQRAA